MGEVIKCPKCAKQYQFRPELAGKQLQCPQCKTTITVPAQKSVNDNFLDDELTAFAAESAAAKARAEQAAALQQETAARAKPAKKWKAKKSYSISSLGSSGAVLIALSCGYAATSEGPCTKILAVVGSVVGLGLFFFDLFRKK